MQSLKGKKLLILGGPALACDIVEKARQMGVYTIVTDWYEPEKSPAKLIADEYAMVSTSDIEELERLIKEKNIDGVITGFIDSTLPYIQELCQKLNLNFYASREQLESTLNKRSFKQMCNENNIPTVKEIDVDFITDRDFPVIVKPTDSSGAKGITVCYKKEDLNEAYAKALSYSKSKGFIVEKYMDALRANINLDYVFCDGKILLSAVGDLYAYQMDESLTPITSAVFYPSVKTREYIENLDDKVRKMFSSMGFKNGFLYIQAFYDNGKFYFYEAGYRLGGGQSYRMIEKMNGVNHLEMLINYSLTGKMCSLEEEKTISPFFTKNSCGLCIYVTTGKISRIEGLSDICSDKNIISFMQKLKIGDTVSKEDLGTVNQMFARFYIVTENRKTTEETIEKIFETLKIYDQKGDNMVLKSYEVKNEC